MPTTRILTLQLKDKLRCLEAPQRDLAPYEEGDINGCLLRAYSEMKASQGQDFKLRQKRTFPNCSIGCIVSEVELRDFYAFDWI